MKKTASLFGVPVLTGNARALAEAAKICLFRHGILHTVNPLMLSYALTSPGFSRVLRDGVNIPDGVGVKLALRLQGERTDVLPGIDLAANLFGEAKGVCFYGGKPGVAERAYAALAKKTKTPPPAVFFDGYGTKREEIVLALRAQKPDLVLVALGTPKQEREMQKLYDAYPRALYVGVGGAFDVWAGDRKRAPRPVRKLGLEWLYRMGKEPKRLKTLPRLFLFSVISAAVSFFRFFFRGKTAPEPERSNKNIVKN